MVIVEVPPAVMLDGLKVAVAPVGNSDAASVTVCAVPLCTVVLIVLVVD